MHQSASMNRFAWTSLLIFYLLTNHETDWVDDSQKEKNKNGWQLIDRPIPKATGDGAKGISSDWQREHYERKRPRDKYHKSPRQSTMELRLRDS
jgi:hypothetical protein